MPRRRPRIGPAPGGKRRRSPGRLSVCGRRGDTCWPPRRGGNPGRSADMGGGGGRSVETDIPNHTAELCEMLWGFRQDLDRVRHQKRKPSVEKVLRVVHAVAQLSGAYLKAVEFRSVYDELPELK